MAALVAADRVIVPVQTEYFALEGLAGLLDTLALVQPRAQPATHGRRPALDDARQPHASGARCRARGASALSDLVYDTVIPRNVRISEAPSHGLPVTHHDPHSAGAAAYFELAREVVPRPGCRRDRAGPAGWSRGGGSRGSGSEPWPLGAGPQPPARDGPRARGDHGGLDGPGGVEELRQLALDLISPTRASRAGRFDEEALPGLADSMQARGVIQPVLVRPIGRGRPS